MLVGALGGVSSKVLRFLGFFAGVLTFFLRFSGSSRVFLSFSKGF